jgi:hypothetical protein
MVTGISSASAMDEHQVTDQHWYDGNYLASPEYPSPNQPLTVDKLAQFYFSPGWVKGYDTLGEYAAGRLNDYGQANELTVMFLSGSNVALGAADMFEPGTQARIYLAKFNDGTWSNCGRYALDAPVTQQTGTVQFQSQVSWVVQSNSNPVLRHLNTGKTELVAPGEKINQGDLISYFTFAPWSGSATIVGSIAEMLSWFDPNDALEWNGVDTATGYLKNPFTRPDPRLIVIRDGEKVAVGANETIGFGRVTMRYCDQPIREIGGVPFRENYDRFGEEVVKNNGWTVVKNIHTAFKIESGWAMVFRPGEQKRLRPNTLIEVGETIVYAIPNIDVPFGSLPELNQATEQNFQGGFGADDLF